MIARFVGYGFCGFFAAIAFVASLAFAAKVPASAVPALPFLGALICAGGFGIACWLGYGVYSIPKRVAFHLIEAMPARSIQELRDERQKAALDYATYRKQYQAALAKWRKFRTVGDDESDHAQHLRDRYNEARDAAMTAGARRIRLDKEIELASHE